MTYEVNLFKDCISLTNLNIPETVTSIEYGAFINCYSLKELVIPKAITTIPQGLLSGCGSLEKLTLPFIGNSRHRSTDNTQYPLGYIFGTTKYVNGIATSQTQHFIFLLH